MVLHEGGGGEEIDMLERRLDCRQVQLYAEFVKESDFVIVISSGDDFVIADVD